MRCEPAWKRTAVPVILLVVIVSAFLSYGKSRTASAAPVVIDHLDGNKTVSWDFSNPADYVTTNVSLAGGAELSQTGGQMAHDTDADFNGNNLTWDSINLTISGGSVASRWATKDLVANGTFASSPPWRFLNSSDGSVEADRDVLGETGRFSHQRPASAMTQFDSMDIIGIWGTSGGGPATPAPQVDPPTLDMAVRHEGSASITFSFNLKSRPVNWALLTRDILPPQDWSVYNRLGVWINTTYTGPDVLQVYLNLTSGSPPFAWESTRSTVTAGWREYLFDLSSFASGLNSVNNIDVRFTNINDPATVWVDDIRLYHYDSVAQSAMISQDLLKVNFTGPEPSTVLLSFRYRVDSPVNLTSANLAVRINNTLWSSPPIPADVQVPWTSAPQYDITSALGPKGTFNLSFVLSLSLLTPFSSSLSVQIDDVYLLVPDYHGGEYVSKPLDLGDNVFFDQLSWSASTHPDTRVALDVRGGWSGDVLDGSWTPWQHYTTSPAFLLDNSTGRFLQYRATLATLNASAPASFDRISFTFHRYEAAGRVETLDFIPPEQLLGWRLFAVICTSSPSTFVTYSASDDNGGSWIPAIPGTSLSSLTGTQIRLRADMATTNATITPRLLFLNVTYEFIGPLDIITVSPSTWSGTADDEAQFTAIGRDSFGRNVPITPAWTDDDPAGSVDSAGLYSAGRVGSWHVCASSGGKIDCANVTVTLGVMASIVVSPASVTVPAGGLQNFTATGADADGNPIPLTATEWSTDVGVFTNLTVGSSVLRAQGTAKTGYVEAREGSIQGESTVTVQASLTIVIQGTVPDIIEPEDSPPWNADLTPYLPLGQDPNDLMWYLEGKDDNLYSVFGESRYGQHVLTFTPVKDAAWNNSVTLWLENRSHARASQSLWVRITPIDDSPVFYDVPELSLRYGLHYVFDYTPYIYDVDTPRSKLILTTNDQSHAVVQGLTVNYSYDASYRGQTVLVRLRISDRASMSETIQILKIGDHTPPNNVKDLPDLTMNEDEVLSDAFAEPLSAYFFDPDGEELSYAYESVHIKPTFWSTTPGNVRVRIIPEKDWFGTDLLTIRAKDPPGSEIAQTIVVFVLAVDDPPSILWQDDVTVKYDVPYVLDLTDFVYDVDTPTSDLTLSTNRTEFATVDRFSLSLLLPRYLLGATTTVPLSISLNDGHSSAWSNITVHVADNWPPELKAGTSLPGVTFNEDERADGVFSLNDYFTDTDSAPQTLTYTIISSKVMGTVDPVDRMVSFSAPPNWNGQEVVHVRAYDGAAYAMGRIAVRVVPVNDAPSIFQIPDQDLGTGGAVAIDLRKYASDIDNNISELSFTTDRVHASVAGYMLLLDYRDGTPSETVTVVVSDGLLQNSTSFKVTVAPVQPPGGNGQPGWMGLLWPWSLIVVLVIVAIIGFLMYNRMLNARFAVEDVFMLGKDGRLIMHTTRHQRADRDEDSLAGMLSAIMAFIRESYDEAEQEDFRSFTFSERQVHVQRDTHFYIVAIYAGEPPAAAQDGIAAVTRDVERDFGEVLADWKGDVNEVRELRAFMDAFVSRRKYRRGDWRGYASKRKET